MKYQLLVSAMNQVDFSLIENMHIDSNAIIINQANEYKQERVQTNGHSIDMFTFNERGVGLSRNSAFMRSEAEIIEFADDDMIFVDGYEKIVVDEFDNHPEADAILFSINSLNLDRPFHKIHKFKKIGIVEARKYGCARLAIRRDRMLYHNLSFSLLFGGGARYGAGEDTLLINNLLKNGLKVYVSPKLIADVKQDSSSWFTGKNEKFYFDKGALMCAMHPNCCKFIAIFMAVVHSKMILKHTLELYGTYISGIEDYRKGTKLWKK